MTEAKNSKRLRAVGVVVGLTLQMSGLASTAWARQDIIAGSRFTPAQIAALGDSAFTLGDEMSTGLFYNPANLAKIRKFNLQLLNYSIGGTSAWVNHLNSNSLDVINLNSYASTMDSYPGQKFGGSWSFFPSISFPFLTFGILAQSEFGGKSDGSGTITYQTVSQLIPAIGTGFRFFNGVVRFGYSLQYVNEAVGTQTASSSSSLNYTSGLSQGSGLSHTFGLSIVIPQPSIPTLSVVVRNAFNTVYSSFSLFQFSQSPSGTPPTELMTVDLAYAMSMRVAPGVNSHWSIAYRDLQNRSDVASWIAHMGSGVELAIKESFFLRTGFRTGYVSFGMGIKKPGAEISLAYYSEEVGSHYLEQADSKFIFQLRTSIY